MAVARLTPSYVAPQDTAGAPPPLPSPPPPQGGDGGTPAAVAPAANGAEVGTVPDEVKAGAEKWATGVCLLMFVAAVIVAAVGAPTSEDWEPAVPADGLTVFALFYVAAFVLERFMEPFASFEPLTPAKYERARDAKLRAAKKSAKNRKVQEEWLDGAAADQAAIDRWRANRALVVLGIATLAGSFIALALRLDFLAAVGIGGDLDVWLRVFATSLVIGGGTKPLHDLVTRIQKAKDNAKDPVEVGGNT